MPLEPPTALAAAQITIRMSDTQSVTRSPFTRTAEIYDWGREIWMAEVRFARRQAAQAAAIRGFLAQLHGMKETFFLGDPTAATPQGTQTADFVLASGATAGNRTLDVTMDPGGTLLSGDYLQLGDWLHVVTADAAADGAGAATLAIWPAVRETASPGASVKSTNARGTWRLASPERSLSMTPPNFLTTSLDLVEGI